MGINIDQITRTKETIIGDERMPGRDDLGDFKMTVTDLLAALAGQMPPGMMIEYVADGDPAVNGDRVILQEGQTVLIADYQEAFDKVYKDQTTPAFFKCDVDGTPNAAGLYFIMQDRRGLIPAGVGDAVVNTRTKTGPTELSEVNEDQGQGHEHNQYQPAGGAVVPGWAGGAGSTRGALGSNTQIGSPKTDGTNGTPRTGTYNRPNIIGTIWGLTY